MVDIVARPTQLDGCWKVWNEEAIDVMLRTEVDSGALHTRRRFTGRAKIVRASVNLPVELYLIFMDWFNVDQQQGAAATYVVNPLGEEEVMQWTAPPKISWPDPKMFTAQVEMYHGAHFP